MMKINGHPDYRDGFFDMLNGAPTPEGVCTPEYQAGWDAAVRSKNIFEKAGFSQDGTDFSNTYRAT